jgi:dipeptidyl aminopeptidase/acylaminoacyl peptidase
VLHFISDRSGWWNLYRWHPAAADAQASPAADDQASTVEPLTPMDAEFGQVMWSWFGASTYAFLDARRIACAYTTEGTWRLAVLDLEGRDDPRHPRLTPLPVPFTEIVQVRARPETGEALFLGAAFDRPWSVVAVATTTGLTTVLHPADGGSLDAGYLSRPRAVEFPTSDGSVAHGLFYAPRNQDLTGLDGESPPLIVQAHGGPTFAVSTALDPWVQYWTSRGLAFLDVAYGGSTGYGRAYRERLNGRWGEVDVDDCISGARYLAERGLVDIERMAIQGSSAGGYTTLAALTFRDVFAAGASYFGISDLEALARETHKFESHYLDRLVAPYPEGAALYRDRSPIHHLEGITCPVILFQGLADPVVPPNQAEMIVAELRKRGVRVEYLAFEGEGHGFRRAETLTRSLEAQLGFYGEVLGFVPASQPAVSGERAPSV